MNYFVTGATGFIGRHLLAELLRREGTIYVLVREGSRGKLDALLQRLGAPEGRVHPVSGDLARPGLGSRSVRGADRPPLPPRSRVRRRGRRGGLRARERRGHEARDRVRERARGRALPSRQLDRGRRRVPRRLPGGHVRRGAAPAPPLPPHEVRVRAARARGRRGEDADLPARDRRRQLRDRRDGQDRRALLLLQGPPEAAPRAARVVPAGRAAGRRDEHRPGRLRGQGDGSHRPPARTTSCPRTRSTSSTPSR